MKTPALPSEEMPYIYFEEINPRKSPAKLDVNTAERQERGS